MCGMGLHSNCRESSLFICGGLAPLWLSFADSSLVVAGGSSTVVVVWLLSSCGRVLFSNCEAGYSLVVMRRDAFLVVICRRLFSSCSRGGSFLVVVWCFHSFCRRGSCSNFLG